MNPAFSSTRMDRLFNNLSRLNDDQCEDNAKARTNQRISDYTLDRDLAGTGLGPAGGNGLLYQPRIDATSVALNDVGVMPAITFQRFGVDPTYTLADTSKASKLANARPFAGMPYMGAGQFNSNVIDTDSALLRGEYSSMRKEYNPPQPSSISYRPMPMIPEISSEIQDPVHYIPTAWQRGGLDTRGIRRSASIQQEHCTKTA